MTDGGILLVENNKYDELLILRALHKGNVMSKVTVVRDGEEALDYLLGMGAYAERNTAETPSVVLMDLKMPKLDGLEVLARLRADPRTSLMPVVILTSSKDPVDLIQSCRAGANSYVFKPIAFDDLAKVVEQIGHYWLDLNKLPKQ